MRDCQDKESARRPGPGGICPYFGECGGCQTQDQPYEAQVADKAAMVGQLFSEFWPDPVEVTPSPVVWHYRNKVDPSFAPKQYDIPPPAGFVRETSLGFKKKGRWFWPLDIEECRIAPEGFGDLLASVRAWYREKGYRAYDSRSGEGFLRCLLVRDTKRTHERMVVLITCPGEFDSDSFVRAVQRAFPSTSIYRGVFEGRAEGSMMQHTELLYGAPAITERLHIESGSGVQRLEFRISPMSFFQTNPLATERLYGLVHAWVEAVRPRVLYDLYGGAGGIAFVSANLVERVWSVENVPEASEDGHYNAAANGIQNVTFVTANVKDYLRQCLETGGWGTDCAAVVDPPRAGLHPKALKRLIELAPPHLLYVACAPKNLAREMPVFLEHYRLASLRAVDLFPHTRHVEVLAAFERTG